MSTALVYSEVSRASSSSCNTSGAWNPRVPTREVRRAVPSFDTNLEIPKSPIFTQIGSI